MWEENNRNEIAAGRAKTPMIRPILIDREIPKLQARLDELSKIADQNSSGTPKDQPSNADNLPASTTPMTAAQKQEFIEQTDQLKLLDDRRQQILARVGDEYIADPPKMPASQ